MKLSGVYAIADDELLAGRNIHDCVTAALQGGVGIVQYRCKSRSFHERVSLASDLLNLCQQWQVPLIINDDVALCKTIGADGVHLGDDDVPLLEARERLGSNAIIGITCHASISTAKTAEAATADYVAFGRFYPSNTKPAALPAEIEILSQARATLSIPIVAIGGINAENGAALIEAGADMLAVVHAIFGAEDIDASTRRLVELFEN
jgi:thiamine-phosphate pyrophosphorylase